MTRFFFTLVLMSLGVEVVRAEDPPPPLKAVQPRVAPAQPVPPAVQRKPDPFTRVTPLTLSRYEEEAEVLEAQADVKKAYIRAAEVGLAAAKIKLERTLKLEASKAVPPEEVLMAKIEVDTAAAQLDIRKAELKEVEVRVKYAKKRVDDAKAGGVRNLPARPAVDPRPVDPGR